jgi:hypothetical protein
VRRCSAQAPEQARTQPGSLAAEAFNGGSDELTRLAIPAEAHLASPPKAEGCSGEEFGVFGSGITCALQRL